MAKVFYIVEGSGEFPFQMLYEDKAYPYSWNDAISLGTSDANIREIHLASDSEDAGNSSSKKNWERNGWKVVFRSVE